IGAGTTLHGLRVSYAAWWRRNGANTREVADLIGDESERMGAHYTRHVEAEQNIIRAFSRISDRPDKACTGFVTEMENARVRLENICRPGTKKLWKSMGGRGGTGRRKGLKIPRWQRRVGSSPTARTSLRSRSKRRMPRRSLRRRRAIWPRATARQATPYRATRGAATPEPDRVKRVRRSLSAAKAKTDWRS